MDIIEQTNCSNSNTSKRVEISWDYTKTVCKGNYTQWTMRGKSKLEILQKRSENCLAVEAWQTRRYVYDMVGRRKPVRNKRGEMPPLPPPKNRSNLQSRWGNASCKGVGRGGLSTLACQNKKKSIVTVKCEKRTVLCVRLPFRWSIDLRDLKDELHVWDEYMYIYIYLVYIYITDASYESFPRLRSLLQ